MITDGRKIDTLTSLVTPQIEQVLVLVTYKTFFSPGIMN